MLRLLWRSCRAPDYRRRWGERFGIFTAPTPGTAPLWIHAVSVGETLAAIPLVKSLLTRYPDTPLVITTTTPTGSARVLAAFTEAIQEQRIFHVYLPYDLTWFINRFLRRIQPQVLIIMETELWPNLIHACATYPLPVILANARLSESSARGYRRLAPLTRNMLKKIYRIASQNETDGNRFLSLGYAENRLVVTGSIKFDLDLSPALMQQASQLREEWSRSRFCKVWLAASTHPGEEAAILDVFVELKQDFPDLLLVLVPRHPERFNSVYKQCQDKRLVTHRRSEGQQRASLQPDVILGDTMGELLAFYGACDVAFVGGSLVPVGGHNLIEPAAWGKAIISGHYLHNFSEISRLLLDQQAMLVCHHPSELAAQLRELLLSEERCFILGRQAQKVALQNRGALEKLLALIDDTLERWKTQYPSQR